MWKYQKCTEAGTELPDCPKVLGKWENDGYCIASGMNPFCGPGMQTQKRIEELNRLNGK